MSRLYMELGLNEREIETLAELTPKKHYYFRSLRGSRRFELELGPLAISFMAPGGGATMDETRRHVEALADRHRDGWTQVWLRDRGLDAWADRLDQMKGALVPVRIYELALVADACEGKSEGMTEGGEYTRQMRFWYPDEMRAARVIEEEIAAAQADTTAAPEVVLDLNRDYDCLATSWVPRPHPHPAKRVHIGGVRGAS